MPNRPRMHLLPLAAVGLALVAVWWGWREPPTAGGAETTRLADQPGPAGAAVGGPVSRAGPDPGPRQAADEAGASARFSLAGLVRAADGTPLGGVEIDLARRGGETGSSEHWRVRSDRRGEFVIDGVIAGDEYRLAVAPRGDYAAHTRDPVIFDAAAPRLEIVLERVTLVDADGIIVDTSQAPVPNFTLRLRSAVGDIGERVVTSDASGNFRLEDFPAGELEINTSGRDYYRIRGVELKADEYNNPVLIVDRGDYRLTGVVVDPAGAPVDNVRVTLKGAIVAGDYHSYSYRSTSTDVDGEFEFADLGSYRYTLGIHAAGFETQIRDHEFQSFDERLEIRLQYLDAD